MSESDGERGRMALWLYVAATCLVASISGMEIVMGLAGLAWIARRREKEPAPDRRLVGLLISLAAWSLLSALFSPEPPRSLDATSSALLWIAAPMGAVLLTPGKRRLVRSLFLLQAGLLGAWALLEFFFWWDGNLLQRVHGPFSHHMTLAGVLLQMTLQGLPRPVLEPILKGRAGRWGGRLALLLGFGGMAATWSRSAVLGAGAGAAVLWWAAPATAQGNPRPVRRVMLAGLGLALLAGTVSVPWLAEMRGGGELSAGAASVQDRLVLWGAGLRMIADHPLLGIGANRVRREADRYLDPGYRRPGPPAHLHSSSLTLAAERGLPAFLLWASLYLLSFLRLRGGEPRGTPAFDARWGAAAAVAAFLVMGLFEDNFDDVEVLFVHLVILSTLWTPRRPISAAAIRS
ncbi:MAG: O-antigen ligase family protein [Acidobacteriota bacterium]